MKIEKYYGEDYLIFEDPSESFKWGLDKYADILNSTGDINLTLGTYTGSYYLLLNDLLRASDIDSLKKVKQSRYDEDIKNIMLLQNVLNSYKCPDNIVVYRYTKYRFIKDAAKTNFLKKGICFKKTFFVSTTLVKELLLGFARGNHYNTLLKIYVPKGTKGAYFDEYMSRGFGLDEQEFILPADTNFKIISNKNYILFHMIKLEVLPEEKNGELNS